MKQNKITRRQFMQTAGVVAAVSALAACGGTAASTSTATSTAASTSASVATDAEKQLGVYWWGNQVRNEGTQAALDLYSKLNPGVTFDTQFASWADYWTKLATNAASHTMQDIIQMDHMYINQYVESDLLVDLTPYIEDGTLDVSGISDSIMESSKVDGGIYAICIGVNAPALVYNKTLLDDNNIAIKDYMNIDEFIAVCQEVYEKTGVKTDYGNVAGDGGLTYLVRSEGKHMYGDGAFAVEDASSFELWYAVQEQGINEGWLCSPEIFVERAGTEQLPLVMGATPDQRSWCWFAYSNQLEAAQAAIDAEGSVLALTTQPSPNPKLSNYLKPGQFFSISVDAVHPEEAAKVIDFWTNSTECNEILMAERGVPAAAATATELLPLLTQVQKDAFTYVNEVATPNCSPIDNPSPEGASEVISLANELQEKVCYKQMTAAEAAAELFEKGNEFLGG